MGNSFAAALKDIKADIKTVPYKPKREYKKDPLFIHEQKFVCGVPVTWELIGDRKIPVLHTAELYIEYPTAPTDVKIPEGTTKASYDPVAKTVTFYGRKEGELKEIAKVRNRVHQALPVPRYMHQLERVEEILDIDLDTGEITSEINIDILDEYSHWLLRLQEFEKQCVQKGLPRARIDTMMSRHISNLKKGRGVDLLDPTKKIPAHLLQAIEYIEMNQGRL